MKPSASIATAIAVVMPLLNLVQRPANSLHCCSLPCSSDTRSCRASFSRSLLDRNRGNNDIAKFLGEREIGNTGIHRPQPEAISAARKGGYARVCEHIPLDAH